MSWLHNRWTTFAAQSLMFFLVSAGTFSSLGVVLPAMVGELHWTWTQAGLGYTFLGLACGLASFAPAVMIRTIGMRATLGIGTLLLALGFGALATTHSALTYQLGTLVVGVAFTLTTTVPGTHLLTSLFQRRSTVIGAYFTIGGLGQVAGPLFFIAIEGPAHQWRAYWWTFVIASLALGAFAALAVPAHLNRAPRGQDGPPEPLDPSAMVEKLADWTVRHALATPQFYVIVGAYTMYLLINTTAHGFAVEHLTERGVSAKVAAGMLSLEALVGAGISVVGGVIGERVRPKILLCVSLAALTVGMAALAAARGYPMMLVYALGVGIGYGLSFLSSTLLLLNYFGKKANLELYSVMCLISTSAAVGPAFGGWARDTLGSFSGVFLLCAGLTLAMLLATVLMTPPVGRRKDAPGPTATGFAVTPVQDPA